MVNVGGSTTVEMMLVVVPGSGRAGGEVVESPPVFKATVVGSGDGINGDGEAAVVAVAVHVSDSRV